MTDQSLLTDVQFCLLEPPDGGASFPSGLWTRAEVLDACSAGQRDLLRTTHLLTTRVEIAVLAGATSVALPANWLATLSVNWRASSVRYPLGPADAFEVDCILSTWEGTTGLPIVFLDGDTTSLLIRLAPTPSTNGTVELRYVADPTTLTGNGTALTVPDEFAGALKYAGLEMLLNKPSRAFDPERAAYCVERYDLVRLAAELLLAGGA
jgi:hypothetical protein